MTEKKKRCRHDRNSWLLGSLWEWCRRCGAILALDPIEGTTNQLRRRDVTKWHSPVGPDKEDPALKDRHD